MTPKTLEQMAEECASAFYRNVDEPNVQRMARECIAIGWLAGAKAALSLPAVEQMRVALVDLMRELNATRDGEGFEIIHWPDTTYGIALAAFDRLSAEVGE